jgi:hypothetical protein
MLLSYQMETEGMYKGLWLRLRPNCSARKKVWMIYVRHLLILAPEMYLNHLCGVWDCCHITFCIEGSVERVWQKLQILASRKNVLGQCLDEFSFKITKCQWQQPGLCRSLVPKIVMMLGSFSVCVTTRVWPVKDDAENTVVFLYSFCIFISFTPFSHIPFPPFHLSILSSLCSHILVTKHRTFHQQDRDLPLFVCRSFSCTFVNYGDQFCDVVFCG